MADSDERDRSDQTPADDATPADQIEENEVEVEDPSALDRATELVSEPEAESDDGVEEPTDAELAALMEPTDRTGEGELVGVGAGRSGATAREARRGLDKKDVDKKGRATPKRDGGPVTKRTGPVTFVRESVAELRKVVYPTGPQLANYFVVVLIFVLFVIAFVSVLDLAFGWVMLRIFG